MKSLGILLPALLGIAAVLQASLNRKISDQWSLGSAVLLNAFILLIISSIVLLAGGLPARFSTGDFRAWFLLPGIFGFCLVVGLPFAVLRWGAMHTFVWVIAAQIMASALWDYCFEGIDFSWRRLVGGLVALGGAWILSW